MFAPLFHASAMMRALSAHTRSQDQEYVTSVHQSALCALDLNQANAEGALPQIIYLERRAQRVVLLGITAMIRLICALSAMIGVQIVQALVIIPVLHANPVIT
jgi:hypothetical protein